MIFATTKTNVERARLIKCPAKRKQVKVVISSKPKETIYKSVLAGTSLVVSIFEILVG